MFLIGELKGWNDVGENEEATIVIQRNDELIKEVKADAPKECRLNKYRITDRMYNRVLDREPEVIVKVKSCEFEKKSSKTSFVVIKMIILEKKLRIYS